MTKSRSTLVYTSHSQGDQLNIVLWFNSIKLSFCGRLFIFIFILLFSCTNKLVLKGIFQAPFTLLKLSSHVWVGWKVWQELELQPFFLLKADNFIHTHGPAAQIIVSAHYMNAWTSHSNKFYFLLTIYNQNIMKGNISANTSAHIKWFHSQFSFQIKFYPNTREAARGELGS